MMSSSILDVGLFSPAKSRDAVVRVTLGKVSELIPLVSAPDQSAQFAYFKLNDHPEMVDEGARLMAEYLKEAGYQSPYFVTSEASTLALAHVLRSQYGLRGITLYKSAQLDDVNPVSVTYKAITSCNDQRLFLGKNRMNELLQAREVIILDSICTKGSTLKAIYDVLIKAGVSAHAIKQAVVLFTEGEPKVALDVDDEKTLAIYSFSALPLIKSEVKGLCLNN